MSHRLPVCLVLCLAACGSETSVDTAHDRKGSPAQVGDDGPPPPRSAAPKPAAKPALGAAQLSFAGDLAASFEGAAATCNQMNNPEAAMSSVQVRGTAPGLGTFDLTIIAEPGEWGNPSVVLNMSGETRASFTYNRSVPAGESVALSSDPPGLQLDLSLREVAGKRGVRVTGSVRCP